jgi:hypothetical protein
MLKYGGAGRNPTGVKLSTNNRVVSQKLEGKSCINHDSAVIQDNYLTESICLK